MDASADRPGAAAASGLARTRRLARPSGAPESRDRAVIALPPIPLPDQWTLGDLERMRLILRGGSVIDWQRLHFHTREEVDRYLRLCLFEPDDPFDRDRLQRILDEAVDYLRTAFRYHVADAVAHPKDVQELFLLASGVGEPRLRKIACLVLKVMHVVH